MSWTDPIPARLPRAAWSPGWVHCDPLVAFSADPTHPDSARPRLVALRVGLRWPDCPGQAADWADGPARTWWDPLEAQTLRHQAYLGDTTGAEPPLITEFWHAAVAHGDGLTLHHYVLGAVAGLLDRLPPCALWLPWHPAVPVDLGGWPALSDRPVILALPFDQPPLPDTLAALRALFYQPAGARVQLALTHVGRSGWSQRRTPRWVREWVTKVAYLVPDRALSVGLLAGRPEAFSHLRRLQAFLADCDPRPTLVLDGLDDPAIAWLCAIQYGVDHAFGWTWRGPVALTAAFGYAPGEPWPDPDTGALPEPLPFPPSALTPYERITAWGLRWPSPPAPRPDVP